MNLNGRSGDTGQVQIMLGPIERRVVTACAICLFSILGYTAKTFADRLDRQGDQLTEVAKQQAVTNAQLIALTVTMNDVPALAARMGNLEGQVSRNTDDLRQMRTGQTQRNTDDIRQMQGSHR